MTNFFLSKSTKPEDYWRGVILYGRNVASYKFALASALLEIRPQAGTLLKVEDLAPVYAKHIARHLLMAPRQGTSNSSQFLEACRAFNLDGDDQKLVDATIRGGFKHVIDAFHVVGSGQLDIQFFLDERKQHSGLRITDEFSKIIESQQISNLPLEVEARWNLVETAWELGIPGSMLSIQHDDAAGHLIAYTGSHRRKSVTSSRFALNGYQRGKCFYCNKSISIDSPVTADVDHFFPHALKSSGDFKEVDQVWNLVLACIECNRGPFGKSMSIPAADFVERLHQRNEYYISSHHPLRETLIQQTGLSEELRIAFLNSFFNRAYQERRSKLWKPKDFYPTEL